MIEKQKSELLSVHDMAQQVGLQNLYDFQMNSVQQMRVVYLIWFGPGVHVVAQVPVAGPVDRNE